MIGDVSLLVHPFFALFNLMEYKELSPDEKLLPFVKCFWQYNPGSVGQVHAILPNGCFELFFILVGDRLESVVLSGLRTRPYQVEIPVGVEVFAVRFLLPASEFLLQRSIAGVLDGSEQLQTFPTEYHHLAVMTFPQRTAFMSDMLHQMLGAFHPEDAKMKLMQAAYLPGQTVADVAEYSGLSCRTINRYFACQFGLPLKRFLSIVRFRSTFPSIGSGVLWPDVECYDQSHFLPVGRFARVFHIYVSVSYLSFTFLQNLAVTEQYGFSMVTVNVLMFLLVSFVWIGECFRSTCRYSFVNLRWRYAWMIVLSVFAYLLPFTWDGTLDWNPVHFFYKNSSTSFCLMTPLFLTLMTLNLPQVSIVTYRITALIGVVMGVYNMGSFLNPHTVFLGILHIPLLSISLYATILSYQKKYVKYPLAELIGT